MTQVESFITSFEQRLAPVEKASSEAWWKLATTGTEEAQEELVRAGMEYNRLFADKGEYELVKSWYEGRHSLDSSILRERGARAPAHLQRLKPAPRGLGSL
jgi:hypothetical protein